MSLRWLRTPLLLAAIAAGLGLSAWWIGRHPAGTGRRIAEGVAPDRIGWLEIERAGGPTVRIERRGETFRLVAPIACAADGDAMDEIVSTLALLESRRTVGGSPAAYGLAPPRVTLRIGRPEGTLRLALSRGEDASGKDVYLQRDEDPRIFVVERRLRDLVDVDVDALRDRRALRIDPASARKVQIGTLSLQRSGEDRWRLGDGTRAGKGKVRQLFADLAALRAERFLSQTPPDAASFETVAVDAALLRVGGACPARTEQRLVVRTSPEPATFCISAEAIAKVFVPASSLRQSEVVGAPYDALRRITFETPRNRLALVHDGKAWRIEGDGAADETVLRTFIEELGAFRALRFLPLESGAFEHPTVVTFEGAGAPEVLRLGRPASASTLLVRRGDEPILLEVDRALAAALEPDPLRFRERRVLSFVRFDAFEVNAEQEGVREVAVKETGQRWRLRAPVEMEIDDETVDALLMALGDLRAERFVGHTPREAFAEARRIEVVVPSASSKRTPHLVEVGGSTPGGCWARVDGGPAFLLAQDKCAVLRERLGPRRLLPFAEEKLVAVELQRRGETTLRLEKRGPDWYAAAVKIEPSRMEASIRALQSLAADDIASYGAKPDARLAPGEVTLRLEMVGRAPLVLRLGPTAGGRAVARSSAYDCSFLVERTSLDEIEALLEAVAQR